MKTCFLIATSLLAVVLSPLRAATITVTTAADNGPGSLRAALAGAADGDTIDASRVTGTILLTSGELLVSNSVDIIGPRPANLAVDGNAASRVFHITPSNTVAISSLTITNGNESFFGDGFRDSGGGIYNDHSTMTVSNCVLIGNSANEGGAIFNYGANFGSAMLTMVNCTLSGNSAGLGGAIYNWHGTSMVLNSTLSDNAAELGGGIYNTHGTLAMNGCSIISNSAGPSGFIQAGGGGIYTRGGIVDDTTLSVVNTTFSGNSVIGDGGAIYLLGGTLKLFNSTLTGNAAVPNPDFPHTVIDGFGGAIYSQAFSFSSTTVRVASCTISDNSAVIGGGVFNNRSTLEIGNTILSASASGGTISNDTGTVTSRGYNLSSDDGGAFLTATGDQINTDPMLGPLQDNGSPTFTHALLCGSPAIDQGKRDTIPELASDTDQRGLLRPVDIPAIANALGGDGSDIGAFEVQKAECGGPAEQINDLIALVQSFNYKTGTANSLIVKLQAAANAYGRGNIQAACGELDAFVNEVNAQKGKKQITPAQGGQLIGEATLIRSGLGC